MIGTLVILPLVGWIELSGTVSNLNMDWSTLYSGKTGFVEIPKHRAIDIDDEIDYKIANFLSH